ncbi:MAG: hypothetical protein IRZ16_23315 [Myxococcaceae bacterium]|nr:hypothetical protein [Myxococcaceae bacterium]
MRRSLAVVGWVLGAVALAACGTTVGDPCTTPDDCGDAVCLNNAYTPGGYCSRQCSRGVADSCPAGSQCIRDGLAHDLDGCFRECNNDSDCRTGYVCRRVKDQQFTVCIGPEGI